MDAELSALIQASARRDSGAAAALTERFYPRVQAIVHRELEGDFRKQHRWLLPLFSTRDIVQDVFADVVQGIDAGASFANEAAFVAYLGTMVRHRLLDAVRHHEADKRDIRRRQAAPRDAEDGVDAFADHAAPGTISNSNAPQLAAELAEQASLLREILQEFPERHRAVLSLRMMDGESFPAIAEQLGYASAESARQAFVAAQAKLLVRLRARGLE